MSDFADKLRTVNFGTPRKPQTVILDDQKVVEVIDETSGRCAGRHAYHADGRVDAVVTPPMTAVRTITTQEN